MLGPGRNFSRVGFIAGVGVIAALLGIPLLQRPEPIKATVAPGSSLTTGASYARPAAPPPLVHTNPAKMGTRQTAKKMPVGQISVNTATVDDLQQLPGVGPKTAQAIVDYRDQFGPYQTVDDIMKVKGIGPKKFAKMQPYLGL